MWNPTLRNMREGWGTLRCDCVGGRLDHPPQALVVLEIIVVVENIFPQQSQQSYPLN